MAFQSKFVASLQRLPALLLSQRSRWIGILRIAFGMTWALAAWLKWQPEFIKAFASMIKDGMEGQPHIVQIWITFWANIITVNPSLFAYLVATTETAIAVCFLLGIFTNTACVVSILLSLGIWSVAEGFGGPYIPGQTVDIGTALPYALLSATMLCTAAGQYYGLDRLLTPRLGRFGFLASGPMPSPRPMPSLHEEAVALSESTIS